MMKKIIDYLKSVNVGMVFTRCLTGAFGLTWLLFVFKLCGIGYMKNVPAFVIFFPMMFYLIASITYIVLKACFFTWFVPREEKAFSKEQIRYIKRKGHLYKKPTLIKSALKRIFLALIAIIITYFILNHFR